MSTQTPKFTRSIPKSNSVDAELQNAEGRYQKVKSRYQKRDISIPKKRSRYRKGDLRDLDTKKKTSRYQKKMHPKKTLRDLTVERSVLASFWGAAWGVLGEGPGGNL